MGLLSTLSLFTLCAKKSFSTPYPPIQIRSQTCEVASQFVSNIEQPKTKQYSAIDFSKQLKIKTSGSKITAQFTPQNLSKQFLKLDELAQSLGYKSFDWVNYVVEDPHGIKDHQGESLSTPYNDPPAGGYEYGAADNYPFYWDIEPCQNCHSRHNAKHPRNHQRFSLTFEDNPSDYRLKNGESVIFVTHLVGRKTRKSPQDNFQWDILSTFSWELTNTSAGVGKVTLLSTSPQILKPSPSMLTQIKRDGGNFSSYKSC